MQGFEFYNGNISTELIRIFHPTDVIIIIVKTTKNAYVGTTIEIFLLFVTVIYFNLKQF